VSVVHLSDTEQRSASQPDSVASGTHCTNYNKMETKTPPFYYANSSLGPA